MQAFVNNGYENICLRIEHTLMINRPTMDNPIYNMPGCMSTKGEVACHSPQTPSLLKWKCCYAGVGPIPVLHMTHTHVDDHSTVTNAGLELLKTGLGH
jgi:hypothetical protein